MHNAQVNVCWPVGIFFSKEIHNTKLIKKTAPSKSPLRRGRLLAPSFYGWIFLKEKFVDFLFKIKYVTVNITI